MPEMDLSARRPKGTVPQEVLTLLVRDHDETGACAPAASMAKRLGMNPSLVSRALKQLLAEGVVSQPHGEGGPYVPLKRPDGTPVHLALVDEAPRQDPLIALIERLPDEKRSAAEAYLRFLVEG